MTVCLEGFSHSWSTCVWEVALFTFEVRVIVYLGHDNRDRADVVALMSHF